MRTGLLLATTILIGGAAPLAAQTLSPEPASAGTPEGARELAGDLAAFVSRAAIDKGIVVVTPDPAGYRVAIDLQPILRDFAGSGFNATVGPYAMVVSRRDDGNWNVFTNDPIKFSTKLSMGEVQQSADYEYGPQVFKGVYSPALATFVSGEGSIDRARMSTVDAMSNVAADFGRMTFDITGTPAAEGAADVSTHQTIASLSETIAYKLGAAGIGTGDFPVTIKSGKVDIDASAKAARMKAIVDLYAFLIANAEPLASGDKAFLASKQDELKRKAAAMMPLWDSLTGSYALDDFAVSTTVGRFEAHRLAQDFTMDGITPSTTIRYALAFEGMTADVPTAPAWVVPLIPQSFSLGMRVEDLDLKTPADILLADLDLTAAEPLPQASTDRIGRSFADHPPRIVIEPSQLKSRDLTVEMSGDIRLVDTMPEVKMSFVATGLDRTMKALQEAGKTAPEAQQAFAGLSMAKGFGKAVGDDRTQWLLEVAADGSLTLNGTQLKGPDVPAEVPPPVDDPAAPGGDAGGSSAPGGSQPTP